MPPKAQKQIVFPIQSSEDFQALIAPENTKVLVIDLHQSWCGPCNTMENNYRALYFNIENAAERIGFHTCCEENAPQEVLTSLKNGPLSCKPRFVVYAVSYKFQKI